MGYSISRLLEDRPELVTCCPDEMVSVVLHRMYDHEFSQLPVLTEDGGLRGLITIESILKSVLRYGKMPDSLRVGDCMDFEPRTRGEGEALTVLLRDLEDTGSVLILDTDSKVAAILTDYDIARYFREKAEVLLLLEEIESNLRELIRLPFRRPGMSLDEQALAEAVKNALTPDRDVKHFRSALMKYLEETIAEDGSRITLKTTAVALAFEKLRTWSSATKSLEDLTLAEFKRMWLSSERWSQYEEIVKLPKDSVEKMLGGVAEIRNKAFHFRDSIRRSEVQELAHCREWLDRTLQDLRPKFLESEGEIESSVEQQSKAILISVSEGTDEHLPLRLPEHLFNSERESFFGKPSKYAPLRQYLLDAVGSAPVLWFRFNDLNNLIPGGLPKSAYELRSWWANDRQTHVQSMQWLSAGWEVDVLDFDQGRVAFRYVGSSME